ncbi:MAG: hypothetical protein HXS50_02890 [Theionarchaea archaeon]|nr:hypothetical protein [Theionarchaea archaeon]
MRIFPIIAIILLAVSSSVWALEDGRIGVLYVGCITRSPPFWTMRTDPLFSISFVQATTRDWGAWGPIQQVDESGEATRRMVRLYMPRTYKQYSENYDVLVIANANRHAVGGNNIEMLARGVREAGIGFVMGGGWETFGGNADRPPWGDSAIGELLPTEDVLQAYIEWGSLIIDEEEHEFIRSLPWHEKPEFMMVYWHNQVTLKPGAQLLAHVESSFGFGTNDPGMVTWEIPGGSRVFAITAEIHRACMAEEIGEYWEYCLDLGSNLVIYLDKRPVPQDLALVHAVREKIFEIYTRRGIVVGLISFLDAFGANTMQIETDLDEVDQAIKLATPLYLQLQWEESLEAFRKVGEMMREIESGAMRFKDRALLWVYFIEWLAVTGTALIAGVILWSIMVRRRLYREVKRTKFR